MGGTAGAVLPLLTLAHTFKFRQDGVDRCVDHLNTSTSTPMQPASATTINKAAFSDGK